MNLSEKIQGKSFITNFISLLIVGVGFVSPYYPDQILNIGLFALSGAITNWLAVYMLFEKVPFLYGSGVVPNRFEEFKSGIRHLVMNQFFTKENLERFLKDSTSGQPLHKLTELVDFQKAFKGLIDVVKSSPLGGMLAMFGGEDALSPLKEPFIKKMREFIDDVTQSEGFRAKIASSLGGGDLTDKLLVQIEEIVSRRLDELTPQMVKELVQEMIHKHLGWLVVWGGVFGGFIGLLASFL
ncbi:MAG: DUF445 family protein [Deltaproteobacteria bacterium]|nr:DUF445 family protein [Deltaproteobacteria bacterium]